MKYKYMYKDTLTHKLFFCCRSKERKKYFKMSWSTKRFEFFFIFFVLTYVYVSILMLSSGNVWKKALLMRTDLTRVCCLNVFRLVMGLYNGHSSLFLECVYFSLLYPSFAFDIWYVVCGCVGVVSDFSYWYFFSVYAWMWNFFLYVCLCGLTMTSNYFFY